MATDLTTFEIAIVVAAVFAGALVKSVTGLGFPLVAIPVMTLFLPTPTAVAVIAIPNLLQNVVLVAQHRTAWSGTRHLLLFCGAGIPGAILGALALVTVPEVYIRAVLTAMLAAYLVTVASSTDVRIPDGLVRRWSGPIGFLAGLFQGGIGISGPIVATWHHGLHLSQHAFVLSIAAVFTLTGAAQVTVLGASGELDGRLLVALALTMVMFVTVPIGARLRRRLSGDGFRTVIVIILAGSCISLAIDLVARVR